MKIRSARIRFLEGGIPFSEEFDDIYFSPEGGLAETEYVFLAGNDLPARWESVRRFTLAELGFGTGLNFLTTLKHWDASRDLHPDGWLHFFSCELFPLTTKDHAQALAFFPELARFSELLLKRLPLPVHGLHTIDFPEFRTTLHLYLGSVENYLSETSFTADAWFLDGFAPSKNETMWGEQIGKGLDAHSRAGTTVATFSVAASAKLVLKSGDFTLSKRKGFGRKREMLVGVKPHRDEMQERARPHSYVPRPHAVQREDDSRLRVAVIGAGLAGCMATYELIQRGATVALFDRRAAPLQEASGNPGGIFMPYLSAGESETSGFALQALSALNSRWDFFSSLPGFLGERTGVVEVLVSSDDELRYQRAIERLGLAEDFTRVLSPQESEAWLGFRCPKPVTRHSASGWLRPSTLGAGLLSEANGKVKFHLGTEVSSLSRTVQGAWVVAGEEFDAVVIAGANESMHFEQTRFLGLNPLRGQITEYPVSGIGSGRLNQPIVAQEYLCPSGDMNAVLGATFDLKDDSTVLDPVKNLQLIEKIRADLGEEVFSDETAFNPSAGRVAFRCTTSDKLPVVGVVPDSEFYFREYPRFFRGKAKAADRPSIPKVQDGLYVLTGFGSRGITYIPLATRILMAEMFAEPSVVDDDLRERLSPARFLLRALRKGEG